MTFLNKTLIAATATLMTTSTLAFADAHALDLNAARLDVTLDTDGDGMVSDDEIIEANMALFDTDGNGAIDADERAIANQMLMDGATIEGDVAATEMPAETAPAPMVDNTGAVFSLDQARLDVSLDTNGDGDVSDEEIIDGNMAMFDTDGNGAIDADERAIARDMLETM